MKAETLRALKNARDLAMKNTLAARIPECGDFGHIAQDLDYVLNDIEAYTAPPRVADVELSARRVITAFEAHGKTRGASEIVKTHHECEAAMVALKAALEKAP